MINAEAGLTEYVIGRSKAIAKAGPIPGRTPTKVPRIVPINPNIRLFSVNALAKPFKRDSMLLMKISL